MTRNRYTILPPASPALRAAQVALILIVITIIGIAGHYIHLWQIEAEARAWARGVDSACEGEP